MIFCLGIWTAKLVQIPIFLVFAVCGLFLVAAISSLNRKIIFTLSLSLLIFCSGVLHFTNSQNFPARHISNFVCDNPQPVFIRGKVTTHPQLSQTPYRSQKTTFDLQAYDLKVGADWQAVEGLIRVTLYGKRRNEEGEIRVKYGDQLLLQGSLQRPTGLRNPGGFDYRAYLARQNIFATLKVKEKDALLFLADTVPIEPKTLSRTKWTTSLLGVRQRLRSIIYQHMEAEQAALLSAILLGERTNLSQDIKDLFVKTGTVHILPIQSRRKYSLSSESNLTL